MVVVLGAFGADDEGHGGIVAREWGTVSIKASKQGSIIVLPEIATTREKRGSRNDNWGG